MTAPTPSLIRWTGYLLIPPALLVVWHPIWMVVTVAVFGVWVIVGCIDLLLTWGKLEGFKNRERGALRMTRGEPAVLELEWEHPADAPEGLLAALQWPEHFQVEESEAMAKTANADGTLSRASWRCISHERGKFQMDAARVALVSRMGWWKVWKTIPLRLEVRVFPSLAQDRRKMSGLFLQRSGVGVHVQRTVGQGREFEKLREYVPGDSFEDVHWKATAKRGRPVTKVHQVERTQEVYVVLDHSRLMGRWVPDEWSARAELPDWAKRPLSRTGNEPSASREDTDTEGASEKSLERVISAALITAMAAEHQGDLFGMVVFSDGVERFLRARSGAQHFQSCRDALYEIQPRMVSPDYEELAGVLRVRLRKRALLLYLTSLDDPVLAEAFLKHVEIVSRQHLVVVCMPRPGQLRPLFEGSDVEDLNGLYDRLGAQMRWGDLRELGKRLQRMGAQFHLIDHGELSVSMVSHYAAVKARQML